MRAAAERGWPREARRTRIVFVSGLSGSGKTTAMAALEDLHFYCVDSLPAQLVLQFVDLCSKANPPIERVALAVDAREERFLRRLPQVVLELRRRGADVEVVFLECADEVLEKRYRETRRIHPLSPEGSVREGVARERRLLVEVASLADFTVDTTRLNVHKLKETMVQHVLGHRRRTVVNVLSFGFRFGTPQSAELLFDLRCLPNPYFEEPLRALSGLDAEVVEYVLKSERGMELFERLADFLRFLLPLYDDEGKAYVTVGIGCTGGRHRSVAVAAALAQRLRGEGREVNVEHRDVERGP